MALLVNKNIQPGHRDEKWHRKMWHAHNGKWEKRNNRRGITTKSGGYENAWRKGKLQVLGNAGSGYSQTRRKKIEIKNSTSEDKKKTARNQILRDFNASSSLEWNQIKGMNNLTISPCKIVWTILNVDKRGTETKQMMSIHKAICPRNDIDYMCQVNWKKEDFSALKIA